MIQLHVGDSRNRNHPDVVNALKCVLKGLMHETGGHSTDVSSPITSPVGPYPHPMSQRLKSSRPRLLDTGTRRTRAPSARRTTPLSSTPSFVRVPGRTRMLRRSSLDQSSSRQCRSDTRTRSNARRPETSCICRVEHSR